MNLIGHINRDPDRFRLGEKALNLGEGVERGGVFKVK